MTDELPSVTPEPVPVAPPIAPVPVVPAVPRKSNKTLWIISAGIVGVLCLCGMAAVALAVPAVFQVFQTKAPVTEVFDSFMTKMEAKDAQGAYALFSPRAQRQLGISKIEQLLQGNNYVIFDGYRSLTIDNLNLGTSFNTNPDAPQGTVAKVTGTVSYEDGFKGTLTGTLEKVNGRWMIYYVNVVVPPDKFSK